MYENSKMISFAMSFADGLETAYRHSYFCKTVKGMEKSFKNMWRDSVFGQAMDNIFNIETHRQSLSYKLFTKIFIVLIDFLNDRLYLEQGILNSRYINLIKRARIFKTKPAEEEGLLKAMFKDSIFMKSLYQFWEGMD